MLVHDTENRENAVSLEAIVFWGLEFKSWMTEDFMFFLIPSG